MTEDFVPFNLAVKLKEKGFREKCLRYYDTEDDDRSFLYWNAHEADIDYYFYHSWNTRCEGYNYIRFDAPTISQVLKWLREEKKIHFESVAAAYGYNVIISQTPDKGGTDLYYTHMNNDGPNDGGAWDKYEDAVIYCIEYTLDNLI